ncbi:AmpD protein [Thiogranum longum]|uniref:1,6-anhydro-N-acetylmuramyl-L-alanine amidase AmpD n=2 Tax=Thiogranum longum TaxID=1537524 RepID=A0A4R1HEW3_9GAMM|nr:AmpD protein [Thiogranum longum]
MAQRQQTVNIMELTEDGDWLVDVRRVLSPNCDERPAPGVISLIVVHGISLPPGEYGGPWIDDFFTNRLDVTAHPYFAEIADLRVSSHLLIRRDGELVQYVPFSRRAWHAGKSCFRGREACNDFSIGIELEGQDETSYEPAQYRQLARVIRLLRTHHPEIGAQDIVGHADIAPGRKTDPGFAFDWERLHVLLA